ncbi:MAG: hypothetical protein V1824_00240 [archaeon]
MKKNVFFGLYNVLIKGAIDFEIDNSYLSQLYSLCKENKISLNLISGLNKEKTQFLVFQNNLDSVFKKKNLICVSEKYLSTLSDLDRQLRYEKEQKDKQYYDTYYKIFYFNNEYKKPPKSTLFVGHDVWTDAYYLRRFTKIDCVLLDKSYSYNNNPLSKKIEGLNTITPTIDELKIHLLTDQKYDYSGLDLYSKRILQQTIFGSNLNLFDAFNLIQKARDKKADQSKNKIIIEKK